MDSFYDELAEILEVDKVCNQDILADFECWDSLTILSIIAFLDQKFKVKKSAAEITKCVTVFDLHCLIKK